MRRKTLWCSFCLLAGLALAPGCSRLQSMGLSQNVLLPELTDAKSSQMSLARLSERHDQIDKAEQLYLDILEQDPQNQQAHHRLGVIAVKNGQFAKAEQHLQVAAKSGTPSAELLSDIGYTLFMMDRLTEAEATLRRALQTAPKNEQARNNLALVLGASGRYTESLAEFKAIVGEAEAYANLGYIRTQNGDIEGAMSDYSRALSLDNTLRPAAEALLQLSKHMAGRHAQQQVAEAATNRAQAEASAQAKVASHEVETAKDERPQVTGKLAGFFEVIDKSKIEKRAAPSTPLPAAPVATPSPAQETPSMFAKSERRTHSMASSEADGSNTTDGERRPIEVIDLVHPSSVGQPGTKTIAPTRWASQTASFQPAQISYGPASADPTPPKSSGIPTANDVLDSADGAVVTSNGEAAAAALPAASVATAPAQSAAPTNWGATARYQFPTPLTGMQTAGNTIGATEPGAAGNSMENSQSGGAATNGQESAIADGSSAHGPLLFQPANNWQKPTWLPGMQSPAAAQSASSSMETAELQLNSPR